MSEINIGNIKTVVTAAQNNGKVINPSTVGDIGNLLINRIAQSAPPPKSQ